MEICALRIAVADDEGFMRKYLQKVLPKLGHQVVVVACSGRELVEQCRVTAPDLVITDVSMPGMDGLEAAKKICAGRPTPVIVISGHHGPEVVGQAMASHVMAFLEKPVRQADLAPAIARAQHRFRELQLLDGGAATKTGSAASETNASCRDKDAT